MDFALQLANDPVVSGARSMTYVTTAIIFMTVMIAVAGIGLRIMSAMKKPAAAPPPIPASAVQVDELPYCPKCGHRTATPDVCPICRFELSSLRQKPSPAAAAKRARRNSFWPMIAEEKDARHAAKQGMWAAFLCAGATTVVVLLQHNGIPIVTGLNDLALLDAAAFAILGIGIRNMSRAASIGALGLYALERLTMLGWHFGASAGSSAFVIIAVTMSFVTAIRGTFAFHRMRDTTYSAPQI